MYSILFRFVVCFAVLLYKLNTYHRHNHFWHQRHRGRRRCAVRRFVYMILFVCLFISSRSLHNFFAL